MCTSPGKTTHSTPPKCPQRRGSPVSEHTLQTLLQGARGTRVKATELLHFSSEEQRWTSPQSLSQVWTFLPLVNLVLSLVHLWVIFSVENRRCVSYDARISQECWFHALDTQCEDLCRNKQGRCVKETPKSPVWPVKIVSLQSAEWGGYVHCFLLLFWVRNFY